MKKLLLTALTLALLIAGATVVLAQTGGGSPSRSAVDVSGPCDEAENAGEPRCADGATGQGGRGRDHAEDGARTTTTEATTTAAPTTTTDAPTTTTAAPTTTDDNPSGDDLSGEDVSGPCDEAEHANDPECTGAVVAPGSDDSVDDSGHGGDDSGHGGGDSGHGGDDSGHGGGDDD